MSEILNLFRIFGIECESDPFDFIAEFGELLKFKPVTWVRILPRYFKNGRLTWPATPPASDPEYVWVCDCVDLR